MRTLLLFAILIFASSVNGLCQEGIEFDTKSTWNELLQKSASTQKLIFLDCYTSWCGPCKGMAKDVFPDAAVGDFMNKNFICTKRDMEKDEGITLNKKYKQYIPGYPTYLLINANGDVIFQVSGYLKVDKFLESMKNGLNQKSWIIMSEQYDSRKKDWGFINDYTLLLEAAYQTRLLDSVKNEMFTRLTFKEISRDSNAYHLFCKYCKNAEDSMFIKVLTSNIGKQYKVPEREVNAWCGKLFTNKVKDYYKMLLKDGEYNLQNAEKLLSNIRRFSFNGREEQIVCMLLYNAAYNNDSESFFDITDCAKNFGMLRYKNSEISNIIRKCFREPANKQTLKKCLQYTKVDPNNKFLYPDEIRNYAYFLEKSGDKDLAKSLYEKADILDKEMKTKFNELLKK